MAMHLSKYCPSNDYIVRSSHKHLQLFWFVEDCLTFSIALVSRKQHVVHVLISPPPPSPVYNKTLSDQHWRYVQKYDHLDARFITVTYHIKAFSLFAIDLFCSEYWGPINNATFRKSPPFSIQENPSSNFTKGHKAVKKGPRQIVHKIINASWDLYFTLSSINKFFKDKWRQNARWG